MKKKLLAVLLTLSMAASAFAPAAGALQSDAGYIPKLGRDSIEDILKVMTVEEKASLLSGTYREAEDIPDEDGESGALTHTVDTTAGYTQGISKYGIPSVLLPDGPAGVRISNTTDPDGNKTYATAWPIATLLASSWDTQLVSDVGRAFGSEVRDFGTDLLLAPALNIQRNPLNGRNFEYYSEDPLVSGKMAAAMTAGIQENGVGTTIKHFAVNSQETDRKDVDSILSERALREIYLRGFEIAAKEGKPWAVMSSYNKINGTYTANEPELLTDVLRGEWGYDGLVMTDWNQKGTMVDAIHAQNDIVMPKGDYKSIVTAYNAGELSMEEIDRSVANILAMVEKTPTFQDYKNNGYKPGGFTFSRRPDSETNAQISREAASQGMVLLKNDASALPLKMEEGKNVALYGRNQTSPVKGGTGSGNVNVRRIVSLREGFANAGIALNQDVVKMYDSNSGEFTVSYEDAAKQAADPKTGNAVIAIGRNSGEGGDRQVDEGDYYLTSDEKNVIKNVSRAYHDAGKTVTVVLNVAGVIEMQSWQDDVDAILLAWQPGQEVGDAIVDVLSGKVNPSGKLAQTIAKSYEDYPSADDFPGLNLEAYYNEDIYVGYRYFSTFDKEVAYPFGYGLSYTTFAYSDVKADRNVFDGSVTITAKVTNTGDVPGREAVQLYLSEPQVKLEKPAIQLRSFAKTSLLRPGESEEVSMTLTAEDFKSYDESAAQWIVEPGSYRAYVAASSADLRGKADFTVPEEIVVQQVENKMQPEKELDRLTSSQSATIITEVTAGGQKVTALAIRYPEQVFHQTIGSSTYQVNAAVNGETAPRTVKRVYTNSEAGLSDTPKAGRYVIIELDEADKNAATCYYDGSRTQVSSYSYDVKQSGGLLSITGKNMGLPDLSGGFVTKNLVADDFSAKSIQNGDFTMNYRFYRPKNMMSRKKYPLVIALHGSGERGDNNVTQIAANKLAVAFAQPSQQEKNKAYVVAPQVPGDLRWNSPEVEQALLKLIDELIAGYNIDADAVYITGLSMGGQGTWNMITKYPERFAAAMPLCGRLDDTIRDNLKNAVSLPISIFHVNGDPSVPVENSREAYSTLLELGSQNVTYTEYESDHPGLVSGNAHHAWEIAYDDTDVLDWMFGYSNKYLDSSNKVVKIEGEDYLAMSGIQLQKCSDVGGGMNVCYIDAGDWMDYEINVSEAGSYNFKFRVSSSAGKASAIKLIIDDQEIANMDVPNTTDYQKYINVPVNGVQLSEGVHRVRIYANTSGWNLNYFTVGSVNAGNYVQLSETDPVQFEAENYDDMFGLGTEACSDAGGGLNLSSFNANDWVEYKIDVPADGMYNLKLRYAANGNKNPALSVETAANYRFTTNLATTGGYQVWKDFEITNIPLKAGKQVFRLNGLNSGFNLNYMSFTPVERDSEGYHEINLSEPVKMEAEEFSRMYGINTEACKDEGGTLNIGGFHVNDFVEYKLDVKEAGDYDIIIRYASKNGSSTGFTLTTEDGYRTSVYPPATNDYQVYQDIRVKSVPLKAGRQVLQLYSYGTGTNINYFTFQKAVSVDFEHPVGSGTTVIEAEDCNVLQNAILATADTASGYYLAYTSEATRLDYKLDVERAGVYDINLKAACGNTAGKIDAVVLQTADGSQYMTSIPYTGGWYDFKDVTIKNVALSAGPQAFRIIFKVGSWNFDALSFDLKVSDVVDGVAVVAPQTTVDTYLASLELSNGDVVMIQNKDGELLTGGDYLGTGSIVRFMNGEIAEYSYRIGVKGDANGDGFISVIDLVLAKAMILRASPDDIYKDMADFNSDGETNIFDLVLMKLAILKG
ncbi:carbohydrate-binding protein [Candidatus Soleaferrea massiliensis]|uniref:carbohydrate-binding protein n=1 Tax=Candidatus Soleaferrea massiliensis TaxID=1470354 RepID=UPI000693A199|nr:carbohydrate-binding protein [Candidatus Soleaferrea massiliensis]